MEKVYLRKTLGLACLALFLMAGAAFAETPRTDESESPPATVEPAPADSAPGMRVVLDPETGELRAPSAEEAREHFGEEDEGYLKLLAPTEFWVEELEGDMLLLHVDPSFFAHAWATLDEDGQLTVEHHVDSQSPDTALVEGEVER